MIRSHSPSSLSDYPVIITLPILWGDQDAFGHVNNTMTIRWFESARIAYMEQGFPASMRASEGTGPILAAIRCNYRRQLHYPDTVHIGARVTKIGRTSMIIEHAVYSQKLQAIAVDAMSTIVVFDYQANRPVRVPDELRQECTKREGRSFDL
jgi:acyl-CoA thioester hydrolase